MASVETLRTSYSNNVNELLQAAGSTPEPGDFHAAYMDLAQHRPGNVFAFNKGLEASRSAAKIAGSARNLIAPVQIIAEGGRAIFRDDANQQVISELDLSLEQMQLSLSEHNPFKFTRAVRTLMGTDTLQIAGMTGTRYPEDLRHLAREVQQPQDAHIAAARSLQVGSAAVLRWAIEPNGNLAAAQAGARIFNAAHHQ